MALERGTMEQFTMSIGDLDLNFDGFMLAHQPKWNIPENGAVLLSIPSNRPRPPAIESKYHASLTSTITTYRALKITFAGCYVISTRSVDRNYLWMQGLTRAQPQPANLSMPELVQLMDSGHEFGEQLDNAKSSNMGRRFEAAVNSFPILARDLSLRSAADSAGCKSVAGPSFNIATRGGIQMVRRCWADLKMVHYNHRGAPYHWIVVPPTEKLAFENRICTEMGLSKDGLCGQFLRHLCLWIDPQQLSFWGIKYQIKVQEPRTFFIAFPGTYYWGFATGFSVVESKYYGGSDWVTANYPFCDAVGHLCRATHGSTAPLTIMAPTGQDDQFGTADLIHGKLVRRSRDGTITYAGSFNKPADRMKPQPMNPQPMNLQPMNPHLMNLQPMNPQPIDPQLMNPQPMNLQPIDPQLMNPQLMNSQPVDPMLSPQTPKTRGRKRALVQSGHGSPMKPQATLKLLYMLEKANGRPYSPEYKRAFSKRYEDVKFSFSRAAQTFIMDPYNNPMPESCLAKPSELKVHPTYTKNTDPDEYCDFCAKSNEGILMQCVTCRLRSCPRCGFLNDDVHGL